MSSLDGLNTTYYGDNAMDFLTSERCIARRVHNSIARGHLHLSMVPPAVETMRGLLVRWLRRHEVAVVLTVDNRGKVHLGSIGMSTGSLTGITDTLGPHELHEWVVIGKTKVVQHLNVYQLGPLGGKLVPLSRDNQCVVTWTGAYNNPISAYRGCSPLELPAAMLQGQLEDLLEKHEREAERKAISSDLGVSEWEAFMPTPYHAIKEVLSAYDEAMSQLARAAELHATTAQQPTEV